MDYVEQAFSISDDAKKIALKIYKESVKKIVHKDYIALQNDSYVELSAIFGNKWLIANKSINPVWRNPSMIAQANVAFNYANLLHCKQSIFIELAKQLVGDFERVKDHELEAIASQMNCILTATTTSVVVKHFAES